MTKYSNVTPYRETNNFFASPTLYENIRDFLHDEIIEVCFTKKDGTERKMLCTLQSNIIDQEYESYDDTKPPKIINKEVMRVYDTEAKGWRSFLLANVKYLKTNLNDYSS
jgi:hypothetical protein|tara:strand:+ start:8273 stop:8602 length:330 start_codon:yes stop_codon:yes gene_type:complete